MPKYKVVMKYEIEYTVDAQNEDEAWMMVQEDTEGMTKRYLDEQTLSVEEVKEQPKMRAEGFFIEEEDNADIQS